MKRWRLSGWLMGLCLTGGILASNVWAHRIEGPFGNYREKYGSDPVVEQSIAAGPYNIYFCAFDMGHEVHMIAYARLRQTDRFYEDLIRVSVHDPDGNAMTVYRDHVTEVIDEPIRWAYHRSGLHTVTVELRPFRTRGKVAESATFSMRLARKSPTPMVLISASGVVLGTLLAVFVLRRRRRNAD